MFNIAAVARQAIAIHSSVISLNGGAVLFLGESGTGKSTHTRLWREHIPGAELLNDDSPIVRIVQTADADPICGAVQNPANAPAAAAETPDASAATTGAPKPQAHGLRCAVERENALLPQRMPADPGHRTAVTGSAQPDSPPAGDRGHRRAAALVPAVVRPRRNAGRRRMRNRLGRGGAGPGLSPRMPARRGGRPNWPGRTIFGGESANPRP